MSKENLIIAPSLLSADPLNYHDEIKEMERLGAHWHHIDVMDGHFVPQLTFGLPIIAALKKVSTIPLDVHIMVTNPDATRLIHSKMHLLDKGSQLTIKNRNFSGFCF